MTGAEPAFSGLRCCAGIKFSDPFRLGAAPMVNVVRLRRVGFVPISRWDGFGIACIVVRRQSNSAQTLRMRIPTCRRQNLDGGLNYTARALDCSRRRDIAPRYRRYNSSPARNTSAISQRDNGAVRRQDSWRSHLPLPGEVPGVKPTSRELQL